MLFISTAKPAIILICHDNFQIESVEKQLYSLLDVSGLGVHVAFALAFSYAIHN